MSVVFDEVVGTVAPEPMPQGEPQEQPSGEEVQSNNVGEQIEKLEQRMARLRAD